MMTVKSVSTKCGFEIEDSLIKEASIAHNTQHDAKVSIVDFTYLTHPPTFCGPLFRDP
jgi:hypothetical protein